MINNGLRFFIVLFISFFDCLNKSQNDDFVNILRKSWLKPLKKRNGGKSSLSKTNKNKNYNKPTCAKNASKGEK